MSAENQRGGCSGCCGGHESEAQAGSLVMNPKAEAASQSTLHVAGLDCANEVEAIQRALRPLAGVSHVRVNLMSSTIVVGHNPSVTIGTLIQTLAGEGMTATPREAEERDTPGAAGRPGLILVVASGMLTGGGLVAQWTQARPAGLSTAVFAAAVITGGWLVLPKAIRALRRFALDMNVLMTVAVIGAAAIGEWSEGAAVAFLFGLSELLEASSLNRARNAIKRLLDLSPVSALRREGREFREVSVEEVKTDDIVAVKSGMRVPLDGVITVGESSINQAPITGECMPVEKRPGEAVFAGTINGEGSFEFRVTKVHSETTLARIVHLVEEAQSQKAPSQRFVDDFARYYTPSVLGLALGILLIPTLVFGGAWLTWSYRSLVLLVIACPCALVISTPVSIVSGVAALARRGVLIKGGVFLEGIAKLRALAVDKTGTITEGKPRVQRVIPWNGTSEEEILRVAAAIDTHSEHPLAQAIVKSAEERRIQFPRSENYQERAGRGAEAQFEGHRYFVGNHRFAHESAVCSDELEEKLAEVEAQAMSVVIVGHKPHESCRGEVLGILAVGDTIRPEAAEAIKTLHAAGVEKVIMLSGDNQRTVDAISKRVGIDDAQGDLLPGQKTERVRELLEQYKHVGMIGDGVNDAPALAAASIGIAMGGSGSDTALETADIVLMQDDLSLVAEAIQLGRRTIRTIRTNLAFALVVKAVFLGLALSGHTSLWLAILADTGATLVVIANALRLLRR